MSTELAVLPPAALSRQVDHATWNALSEIYGDPSPEKLGLVLDYCRARKMDPLKKPVHIVPVWSKKRNMMVETIWPAITEVRATAHRTAQFAGKDATRFGPMLKERIGSAEISFPEWAEVTVYRIVSGIRCNFVGPKLYWIEAYAKQGKEITPNAMWTKRPSAQLEKCAEAAALRAAFPEELGSQPTSDEMEGQTIYDGDDEAPQSEVIKPEDRPKIARKAKGIAAADSAAGNPAQTGSIDVQATETKTEPAPAPEDKKPEEKKPDPAPEKKTEAPAENPAPPRPVTALADREIRQFDGVMIDDFETRNFGTEKAPNWAVKAKLSGAFEGFVYDRNFIVRDGRNRPSFDYVKGQLVSITLEGKKRTDNTVGVTVKSAAKMEAPGASEVP